MICSRAQRSAYILVAEEHEYVLTPVLCFSEFSFAPPIQHKCQLLWVRMKESKCDARGLHWDIAYTVLTGKVWAFLIKPPSRLPRRPPWGKRGCFACTMGKGFVRAELTHLPPRGREKLSFEVPCVLKPRWRGQEQVPGTKPPQSRVRWDSWIGNL